MRPVAARQSPFDATSGARVLIEDKKRRWRQSTFVNPVDGKIRHLQTLILQYASQDSRRGISCIAILKQRFSCVIIILLLADV